MERQKFEDSWKDAFEQAQVNPSQEVWTNIELDLARAEGDRMKRRLFFYKMVAAASVVFAMCIGGVGVYMIKDNQRAAGITQVADNSKQENVSSNSTPGKDKVSDGQSHESQEDNNMLRSAGDERDARTYEKQLSPKQPVIKQSNEVVMPRKTGVSEFVPQQYALPRVDLQTPTLTTNPASKTNDLLTSPTSPTLSTFKRGRTNSTLRASNNVFAAGNDGAENVHAPESKYQGNDKEETFKSRNLPLLVETDKVESIIEPSEQIQPEVVLAKEVREEKKNKRKKEDKGRESLWASVGFSTGAFNSVNSMATLPQNNFMSDQLINYNTVSINRTLKNETEASGVTYSAGVNIGGKISRHWVLQGGLNYMSQNSEYISEVVASDDYQNFMAVSSVEVNSFFSVPGEARLSSERLVTTVPHTVNNSLQYINIPVQAGYIVIDRDFSVQLNGGISTDLFIQSTVTPQRGNLEEVTEKSGPDSPYKAINFSGMVGTDFGYRLGDHYRVSLSPGVRYPFSSIYKSAIGLQSTPVTFDIALRFRYIFQ